MPSPIPYLTPYTQPGAGHDGIHRALEGIRTQRAQRAREVMFEQEQERLRQAQAAQLAMQRAQMEQNESQFGRELGFKQSQADALRREKADEAASGVLEKFSESAARGDEAGVRALMPLAQHRGVDMNWEQPAQPSRPLPPLPGDITLRRPNIQAPQPSGGSRMAPSLGAPQLQAPTPEPLEQPAPEPEAPAAAPRAVILSRGGQTLGRVDLSHLDEIRRKPLAAALEPWMSGPQDDQSVRMAQLQTTSALMPTLGQEGAVKFGQGMAEDQLGRRDANERARSMQISTADRANTRLAMQLTDRDFTAYKDVIARTTAAHDLDALIAGDAATNAVIEAASSDNPIAQSQAIGEHIKSVIKGVASDRDTKMAMQGQSVWAELEARLGRLTGDPHQNAQFMQDLMNAAQMTQSRFEARRIAAAPEARNRVLGSRFFSNQQARQELAQQAEEDILGVSTDRPVSSPRGDAAGQSSGASTSTTVSARGSATRDVPGLQPVPTAMPDGSQIPNLGVTGTRARDVPLIPKDPQLEAEELLR